VQAGGWARLLLPVQKLLQAKACSGARLRSLALVQQRLLLVVFVTEVAVGARSPLGTDLLQIALEVDWHPLTGAHS
jgi:hypothetical protein